MKFNQILNQLSERKDPDRVKGGYKAMATRLSKDLGKNITPSQVENYLQSLEKKDTADDIEKRSKSAKNPGDYEWGTKYKILKNHFSK